METDLLELDELETRPAEGEETNETGEQSTETTTTGEQQETVTSLFEPGTTKVNPVVRETLSKIKGGKVDGVDPHLGSLLIKAVSRVAELDREFPTDGLREAIALRDKVEEFGGLSGIEQKLEGVRELDGLAQQFMAGDPAFVEDMIASSPESFAAMAPVVFARYAELQPEGFGAYVGRIVYGDMQRNDVPLLMMRLQDTLGDNAKAKEVFEQLNTYLGGFKTLADKPMPAVKTKPAEGRTDDLSKREEAVRAKEWKIDRETLQRSVTESAYQQSLAGRKPDTEERAQIKELFIVRSKAAADRLFPGWGEKSQRFIKSGDKEGYLRYMRSIYSRVVPDAMASAVNATLKGKKPPTKADTTRTQTQRVENTQQRQNGSGTPSFTQVSKEPGSFDIDYNRTSSAMLKENRAVLKDGRKVSWK